MAMGYDDDESSIENGVNVSFNDSYYYSNESFVEDWGHVSVGNEPPPFPKLTAVVFTKVAAFLLNIIVTIIGNGIVITIIIRNKNKNMRSATYYYLMNLAIADLIVACFSEWILLATLLKEGSWPFGVFMCKFSTFIQGKYNTLGHLPFSSLPRRAVYHWTITSRGNCSLTTLLE